MKEILKFYRQVEEADINAKDSHGYTALHTAASSGNDELIGVLLDVPGIDVNARNEVH